MARALDDDVEVARRRVVGRRGREAEGFGGGEPRRIARRAAHMHVAAARACNLRGEQADRPGADDEHAVTLADPIGIEQ